MKTELRPGLAYDAEHDCLIIDGVRVSPELIQAAFLQEGERSMVIFEPDGSVTFLTSVREGDLVTFTKHERSDGFAAGIMSFSAPLRSVT